MRAMILLFAAACSDFSLANKPDPTAPIDTGTPPETTESTPEPEPEPEPTCDDAPLGAWAWSASAPFAEAADPVDAAGRPFFDPSFDDAGYATVVTPDRDIPIGLDRVYLGRFTLDALPPSLLLSLQSDDGISLWVNGQAVGQWGGAWQEEGCVNENARCLVTVTVPPVDVTPWLVLGDNVVAARVSNPVENAYFEILPSCED